VEVHGRLVVKDVLRARIDELGYAPRPYVGDVLIGVNKMILPLSMDFQRGLSILRKAKVEEGRAGMSASSNGVELIFCEYPGFVKQFEEEIVSQISERIDQRSINICENFMQSSSNNSSSAKPPEFSTAPANQISESIDQTFTNICENFMQYSSNNSSSANRKKRHSKPPKFQSSLCLECLCRPTMKTLQYLLPKILLLLMKSTGLTTLLTQLTLTATAHSHILRIIILVPVSRECWH